MFCSNCGLKIHEDAKFCMSCGSEVSKSSPTVDENFKENDISFSNTLDSDQSIIKGKSISLENRSSSEYRPKKLTLLSDEIKSMRLVIQGAGASTSGDAAVGYMIAETAGAIIGSSGDKSSYTVQVTFIDNSKINLELNNSTLNLLNDFALNANIPFIY